MRGRPGDRLFYYPTRDVYGHPEDDNLTYESAYFNSAGR